MKKPHKKMECNNCANRCRLNFEIAVCVYHELAHFISFLPFHIQSNRSFHQLKLFLYFILMRRVARRVCVRLPLTKWRNL